jgi:hypothetical protein
MRRITLLFLALLAAGAQADSALPSALEAAIAPDSDFVARIDARALEGSPFLNALWGDRISAWTGRLAASGLAPGNVRHILIAAPGASIRGSRAQGESSREIPSVVAVALAKPLDLERLSLGLASLWERRRGVERSRIGEHDVLALAGATPADAVLYAGLSSAGTTVFLSTHGERLGDALSREKSGSFENLASDLSRLEATLPRDAAVRAVMLPPALWREGESSAATMSERVLQPFRDMKTLALGLELSDDARLLLVGEMPDEEAARRGGTLIATFIFPSLQQLLSERTGAAIRLEDAFDVETEGATVRVSLRIAPEDLKAVTGPR